MSSGWSAKGGREGGSEVRCEMCDVRCEMWREKGGVNVYRVIDGLRMEGRELGEGGSRTWLYWYKPKYKSMSKKEWQTIKNDPDRKSVRERGGGGREGDREQGWKPWLLFLTVNLTLDLKVHFTIPIWRYSLSQFQYCYVFRVLYCTVLFPVPLLVLLTCRGRRAKNTCQRDQTRGRRGAITVLCQAFFIGSHRHCALFVIFGFVVNAVAVWLSFGFLSIYQSFNL